MDSFDIYFFFFQAEDGIRDLVRSRGLGDVYKRQILASPFSPGALGYFLAVLVGTGLTGLAYLIAAFSVSYTHLTLPTIYSV